jgi:hypothetical protein
MLALNHDALAAIEKARDTDAFEASFEHADLADSFLDPDHAGAYLDALVAAAGDNVDAHTFAGQQRALFHARRRQLDAASDAVADLSRQPPATSIGLTTLSACVEAYVAAASASSDALDLAQRARDAAMAQVAWRWQRVAELLAAYSGPAKSSIARSRSIGRTSPWNLTFIADLVVERVDDLGEEAWGAVVDAATRHPARWRFAVRHRVDAREDVSMRAAALLDRGWGKTRREAPSPACSTAPTVARGGGSRSRAC